MLWIISAIVRLLFENIIQACCKIDLEKKQGGDGGSLLLVRFIFLGH